MADIEPTYTLVITASDITGIGHHQFTSYIEETTPTGEVIKGTPAVFGIDPTVLQSRFAGDPEQWRTWVAGEMLKRHKTAQAVHAEVLKWKGQKVPVK
jgi:hypothetical protein